MQCGLLGQKLGHSYSPLIHSFLADYKYTLYEQEPDSIAEFLANSNFSGINVTIPYKKAVIPFCHELSDRARQLGAVNTIVRRPDGTLIGHNTDYFGFYSMVQKTGLSLAGKKVLVLGSGGASVTVQAVLQELKACVVVISRSGENNYENISRHKDASVIVNTTPVGMYPNTGVSPVDLDLFPCLEGVLDLIYNPARTKLIMDAETRGLVTENGLHMLVAQAKESAEWFSGKSIPDDRIDYIYQKLRMQMENIVLIGMPGCGKSTIGKLVAKKLDKTFIDADTMIIEQAKKSIPDIFAQSGEVGFRKWETAVLADLGKCSGAVIATGGGCVTVADNYPLLHQNSRIYWIKREIDQLETDGRPLSKSGNLTDMYQFRKGLYERFADYTISNDKDLEAAANQIVAMEECL